MFTFVAIIFAFAVLSSIGNAQKKQVKPVSFTDSEAKEVYELLPAMSPLELAQALLALSNRVSNGQLTQADRDKLSEQIEEISGYIQKMYNTGNLCHKPDSPKCIAMDGYRLIERK